LKRRFLLLSPTSITIYNVENNDPYLAAKFTLPHLENGHLQSSCWITPEKLAVLTRLGKLMIFEINLTSIRVQALITPLPDNSFLLVGDSFGNLLVFNRSYEIVQTHQISECPIKRIAVSVSRGLLLTADSRPYHFNLSAGNFPGNFELTPIEMAASIIAVSEGGDIGAVYDPKGQLQIVSSRLPIQLFHNVPDGGVVVALTRQQIGIWTQSTQRLTFVPRSDIINPCSVAVSSRVVVIATEPVFSNTGQLAIQSFLSSMMWQIFRPLNSRWPISPIGSSRSLRSTAS
jgi:hypothetical protein